MTEAQAAEMLTLLRQANHTAAQILAALARPPVPLVDTRVYAPGKAGRMDLA